MTPIIAVSDASLVSIVTAFFALLGTVFTGVMAYATLKLKQGQDRTEEKLEVTNADTATKLDSLADVADKTHRLVNSAMGVVLRSAADTARRLAHVTRDPKDEEAATVAEKAADEHERNQLRMENSNA